MYTFNKKINNFYEKHKILYKFILILICLPLGILGLFLGGIKFFCLILIGYSVFIFVLIIIDLLKKKK